MPPATEARSPNHCTAREVPIYICIEWTVHPWNKLKGLWINCKPFWTFLLTVVPKKSWSLKGEMLALCVRKGCGHGLSVCIGCQHSCWIWSITDIFINFKRGSWRGRLPPFFLVTDFLGVSDERKHPRYRGQVHQLQHRGTGAGGKHSG